MEIKQTSNPEKLDPNMMCNERTELPEGTELTLTEVSIKHDGKEVKFETTYNINFALVPSADGEEDSQVVRVASIGCVNDKDLLVMWMNVLDTAVQQLVSDPHRAAATCGYFSDKDALGASKTLSTLAILTSPDAPEDKFMQLMQARTESGGPDILLDLLKMMGGHADPVGM